ARLRRGARDAVGVRGGPADRERPQDGRGDAGADAGARAQAPVRGRDAQHRVVRHLRAGEEQAELRAAGAVQRDVGRDGRALPLLPRERPVHLRALEYVLHEPAAHHQGSRAARGVPDHRQGPRDHGQSRARMTGDRFRLDGRTAAVIGAGSGIGEAVARACAEQGARVFCLDKDGDKATATAKAINDANGKAEAASLDIRKGAEVETCFEQIRGRAGRLDACVCTPSINVRKTLLAYSEEEFEKVVALNLRGSFNVLRAAGRLMSAAGTGSIVLVSSIRSQVVEPGQGVYAM